jgi:hypothetical protein
MLICGYIELQFDVGGIKILNWLLDCLMRLCHWKRHFASSKMHYYAG